MPDDSKGNLRAEFTQLIRKYGEAAVFAEAKTQCHRGPWRLDDWAKLVQMARLMNHGKASGRWPAACKVSGDNQTDAKRLLRKFNEDEQTYSNESKIEDILIIMSRMNGFLQSMTPPTQPLKFDNISDSYDYGLGLLRKLESDFVEWYGDPYRAFVSRETPK